DRRPGHQQQQQQQQNTGIAPALLPDPGPSAPTSVGETYKNPQRYLGEAICKKEALS
ncbi:hypothetical protein GBF38_010226, partial [Nibea albiflora]